MNIYGERYSGIGRFISYCQDLNVRTSEQELEHYEKLGAMYPVARIVYPDKYIIQTSQLSSGGSNAQGSLQQWPEILRLREKDSFALRLDGDLADDELVHCFDKEMGRNKLLSRPNSGNYQPWDSYRVAVPFWNGGSVYRSTAEHFYSYWQVHQLYLIQKYPDLCKNYFLISLISDEMKEKYALPRHQNMSTLADFNGMAHYFHALSFWTTAYRRERNRAFANTDEMDGLRKLDDNESKLHLTRLSWIARRVQCGFAISRRSYYQFLRNLIGLYQEYRRAERYKLAEEVRKDIFTLEDLIELNIGHSREKISEELGRYSYWDKQDFRHLDTLTKELDDARRVMVHAMRNLKIPNWTFSEAEIDELLDFCNTEGLSLLVTALSGMGATGEDEYRTKFRRVTRYTNLKNILTSYEYLLKDISEKGNLKVNGNTLNPCIRSVFSNEYWIISFKTMSGNGYTQANTTSQFANNMQILLGNNWPSGAQASVWARAFLITCLARNYTVHSFPTEDPYYGDIYGKMLDAVLHVMFYTWKFAKSKGWV